MNQKYYDLTNPQKSIWNMEEFFEGTTINNICTPAVILEKIDEKLLTKAINNVVEKNDNFRIQIDIQNGIPKQYIVDFVPFDIDIIHIKDESNLKNIEQSEVSYKFNIINSCLFRFKIAIFENGFGAVILTSHHIIADSWSLGLVIKSIMEEYHALISSATLPAKNTSYINYINSEEEYKKSKKYELDKSYWDKVFELVPEQASFPSMKNNSKKFSFEAERVSFELDIDLVKNIKSFCGANKISIFAFLMSIYSIYLGRVSNLDSVVIGTPILNRSNHIEKETMGMFVNTTPVKIDMPSNTSFIDFSSGTGANLIGILKHQKYSYNQILEDLRKKNNNVPNLYNVLISYQITKAFDKNLGNYTTDWVFNNFCANDFNIHIMDINDTGKLVISYDFLTGKYDLEYAKNVHLRILHMIEQILNNNNLLTSQIEIVTLDERNKILNTFSHANVNYPKDKTIVDLFEQQVRKTPNNIAVVFENEKLTYQELNNKANSLANYLKHNGVKYKDVVGIRLNKSLEMIVGILAIIKAGGCYLPINMQYPQDRVEFMLKDSSAKFLLGNTGSLNTFELSIKKLDISLENKEIYNYPTSNLNIQISPEDLIYIIYTSGSTGTPKGAMLCHRNLVRLFVNDECLFDFNENDVWTMFHSFSFDFSVWEMYGALLFGGKLVLVPEDIAQDPKLYLELMRKERVTILNQTPTYFYKLLDVEKEIIDNSLNIRYIIFGGEALKPNLIKAWRLKYPKTRLINMYGITETTVHVTYKDLSNEDLESPSSNIGTPIPTLHTIIVDKDMNLLPFGVTGEICVLGEGVFKGYLNREDLNKSKLVNIPEYSNKLIYRSGDTAVMYEDGHLEYIGRIDNQIKIRGFRVELGEIEEKILKFSDIDTCIVTKKIDENNRELLCAYYISKKAIDISSLKSILNQHLPAYMVPQYFIEIDKVPININGKTDFRALPLPNTMQTTREIINPRNKIDTILVDIYKKYLHIENVSLSDSFYDLGGDSLTAIVICEDINQILNTDIKIRDILEKETIMNLSDYISNLKVLETNIKDFSHIDKQDYYPLSSAQKRIYYSSSAAGEDSVLYNLPAAIIFDKKPDLNKLNVCFNILIKRHSSLRTYFEIIKDDVFQKIASNVSFELETSVRNDNDIDKEIQLFVKPFVLSKAPLFRAKFISLKDSFALLFDMHHIISDGLSVSILTDELCKLYNNEELAPISFEYIDYANWELNILKNSGFKDSKEYWVNKFKDYIPVLNMPTDFPRPAVQSFEGSKVYKTVPSNLTKSINNLAKSLGVSNYIFLLACYYVLLSKYSSQEDIIVGTPSIGRSRKDLLNIIGMFVSTLALKNTVDSNLSFRNFLDVVKENFIEALEHQDYPFDELVNNLNIIKDTSRNPLFDTMFIYQNNGITPAKFNGLNAKLYIPDTKISKFDLSLEVIPNGNELNLSFEYATSLFKISTIERFSNHFINILHKVVDNVDLKISDIDILSDKERDIILNEFNNTKMDYPKNKTLVQLFEEQVEKTPDNIAVVFGESSLTFKELNEKANGLAWYLRYTGIKNNDIVSIMTNRSLELMVCIIAVLKSGACYIPIDPNYPKDRVEYMLDNSNCKILLADKLTYNSIDFSNKIIVDLQNYNFTKSIKNLPSISKPSDTSYIIYTSGSTGKPKGVVLNQQALTNLTYFLNDYVCFLKNNKYIAMASVTTASFDIFIFETLIALQKGLKVVIANEDEQRLPNKLNTFIEKNNIKAIQMTPSRMRIFVDNVEYCPCLSNLDYVVLAGEPLPDRLLKDLLALGIKKVYNGYGPSETTVFSSFTDVTDYEVVNIGKPLANTQMYILDQNLLPLPVGVPGELYIAGDGVGKGYLNNKEMTDERFIPNPFIKNSIMYKTGDCCKFLENGEIAYIERLDNQVKIRGLRIELEEIENKLLEFPNIKKAKIVKQTVDNRDFISAYYVSKADINANDIRKFLAKDLPNYMIPSYFTKLDEFPYTPNGKINKKALPLPNDIVIEKHVEDMPPTTKVEIGLVEILKKLLKVSHISLLDNFFELGGDSLTSILLCTNIKQKFNIDLSFKDIASNPIIKDLANFISNSKASDYSMSIPKCEKMDYYPTSSAQRRMYLASLLDDNSTLYNICGGILLDRMPDVQKLQNAFNTIVSRHDILRSYFEIINDEIVQKVSNDFDITISVQSVSTNDIDELFKKYQTVFNLSTPPLFKILLLKLPNSKILLMLDIHHIIFDGTSLNILTKEVSDLYNENGLPELSISYKDFAVWEYNQLKNNGFKESKEFWLEQFKDDIPILNMPTTFPRPASKSYEGNTFITYFDKALKDKIVEFANNYNVTPYMLMLCAYYVLLYRYTNQEDIIVGSPVSARIYDELDPLLGMFVNSIPLRNTFSSDNTFEELLKKVQDICLNAFAHQDYPFDELVNELNIHRSASRNPLFDTMFIYQTAGFSKVNLGGIEAEICSPVSSTSKFDISVEVIPQEDGLKVSFEYATELFDKEFIDNFANTYKSILEIILSKPTIKISNISAPTNKLLNDFSEIEISKTNYEKAKYISPTNNLEQQIVDIFEKLLGVKNIGIDDNFFDLGGDSLLAISLQIELLKQNLNTTYSEIYMHPTVRELSKQIGLVEKTTFSEINTAEFEAFDTVLNNTCKFPKKIEYVPIGNILITGCTGFLGAHVLDKYLQSEKGIAYCLIRSDNALSLKDKLLNKLHFYFGDKYDDLIGTRIIIVNADMTQNNFGMTDHDFEELAKDISCVVNCAAKVSHYGNYNSYKKINVDGTESLLKFAMKFNKRLYHISTLSISGNALVDQSMSNTLNHDIVFRENNFYINQSLDNVYVRSKFEAEKLVLQYILKGVDAYILRVGNLMNRYEDGVFQPNIEENAFVTRILSIANIGYIPDYLLNADMEFTPIDLCGQTIIKLMQYPSSINRIFHVYNHNLVNTKDFVNLLKNYIELNVTSNEDFVKKVESMINSDNSNEVLSGILRDFDKDKKLQYESEIKVKSDFTTMYLEDIGFTWPKLDENYLTKFLNYFITLGYIRKKGEM